jgi:hypothetical protein
MQLPVNEGRQTIERRVITVRPGGEQPCDLGLEGHIVRSRTRAYTLPNPALRDETNVHRVASWSPAGLLHQPRMSVVSEP